MASTVNPQNTDAVTQANVKVVAEAPAVAMGSLYQSMAHSLGLVLENAAATQHQLAVTAQAAATQGVAQIYAIDAAADATAIAKILKDGGQSEAQTAAEPKSQKPQVSQGS